LATAAFHFDKRHSIYIRNFEYGQEMSAPTWFFGLDWLAAFVMFGKPNLVFPILDGKEAVVMARPPAQDLTQRELEVMQVFWKHGALTAAAARDRLAPRRDLTYTTVATLVRILHEKSFLRQVNDERPFVYVAARPYEEVSGRLLGDMLQRVFRGSREQLLLRLVEQRPLTERERAVLQSLIEEGAP
jgi:predicted transcriptional regulator